MYHGWNNEVTYHWAKAAWNDEAVNSYLSKYFKGGSVAPTYLNLLSKLPLEALPENMRGQTKKVDLLQFYLKKVSDLYFNGEITKNKINDMLHHFNKSRSESTYMPHYLGPHPIVFDDKKGFLVSAAGTIEQIPNNNQPTIEEQPTMEKIEIRTVTYVNDADVASMDINQKAGLLAGLEEKIAELKAIKTPSKMITQEISRLTKDLAALAELFDAGL